MKKHVIYSGIEKMSPKAPTSPDMPEIPEKKLPKTHQCEFLREIRGYNYIYKICLNFFCSEMK